MLLTTVMVVSKLFILEIPSNQWGAPPSAFCESPEGRPHRAQLPKGSVLVGAEEPAKRSRPRPRPSSQPQVCRGRPRLRPAPLTSTALPRPPRLRSAGGGAGDANS